jgi:hypothetical protein
LQDEDVGAAAAVRLTATAAVMLGRSVTACEPHNQLLEFSMQIQQGSLVSNRLYALIIQKLAITTLKIVEVLYAV